MTFQTQTSRPGPSARTQAPGDGSQYAFKPSLVGSARQFELRPDGLWWSASGKSAVWPYNKIAAVRLSYRPVSMQSRRFRADIENTLGERVTLYSTTWHTVALMSPQDDAYRAFIVELHRRVATANPGLVLVRGINPKIHLAGLCLIGLVCIALAGLMIRALLVGQFTALLFLAAFAALFGWQIGGFLKRNAPGRYTLDPLPRDLLP